jgi:hypothetical protein
MKSKLTWISLIVIAAAIIWFLAPFPQFRKEPKVPSTIKSADPVLGVPQDPALPNSVARKVITQAEREAIQGKQERYLAMASMLGRSKNKPINFYGRIIDQHNQPVAGVVIKLSSSYFPLVANASLYPNTDVFERVSDADGRFSVLGRSGLSMSITLKAKQGYQFDPDNKPHRSQLALNYTTGRGPDTDDKRAGLNSTADKPYVFRVYKTIGAEALFKDEFSAIINPNGEPFNFSLITKYNLNHKLKGKSGGDFAISVNRSERIAGSRDFDWSVQITGVDTHLQETEDVFLNLAPESGYKSKWEFSCKPGGTGYKQVHSVRFYYKKINSPGFGCIYLTITPDYRPDAHLGVEYRFNPSGSRNLEYDSEKKLPNPE